VRTGLDGDGMVTKRRGFDGGWMVTKGGDLMEDGWLLKEEI